MGIQVLCSTCWTVRAKALANIVCNYAVLQNIWEETADVLKDTKSKARINNVAAQMKRLDFLFGTVFGEMLLQHCDNLSQTLQSKTISAAEGKHLGKMVIDTLQGMRKNELFNLFWENVCKPVESFDVEQPQLPHKCKFPRQYDDGNLIMECKVEIL